MNSIVPETPSAKRRRERRRFVPRLPGDPESRAIQVGIVATILIHLLVILAVPRLFLETGGHYTAQPHPSLQQFNIELTPEEVPKVVPPPKPPQPQHYVETNPNAPVNEPDKTNNFAAQNQQAAQPKAAKKPTGDHAEYHTDKKFLSNQVVSGQLTQPQPTVIAPPPEPVVEKQTKQPEKKQVAAREQNPLPGITKDEGDSKDSFGSNIAKIARNAKDVPHKVEGTPDAPLIEGALGMVNIDPKHPMPRPHLDQIHARPAVFQDNEFGAQNIGLAAYDARWSQYGQYLRQLTEAVQIQWDKLLSDAKTYPSQGSLVTVTFVLKSDGTISSIVNVKSDAAGRQGKDYCVAAITIPSPYDKWSKEMIQVLGEQQQMTFVFYYQ